MLVGGSYSRAISIVETKTQRYNYANGSSTDIGYSQGGCFSNYNPNQISVIGGMGLQFANTAPDLQSRAAVQTRTERKLNNYVNSSAGTGGNTLQLIIDLQCVGHFPEREIHQLLLFSKSWKIKQARSRQHTR